jgi:hypothetical protein
MSLHYMLAIALCATFLMLLVGLFAREYRSAQREPRPLGKRRADYAWHKRLAVRWAVVLLLFTSTMREVSLGAKARLETSVEILPTLCALLVGLVYAYAMLSRDKPPK